MSDEQWMAEHKGRLIKTVGEVWYCDDECGCSRAVVVDVHENKRVRGVVRVARWEGEYHHDDEPGAEEELAAYREALAKSDPEEAARIEWQ